MVFEEMDGFWDRLFQINGWLLRRAKKDFLRFLKHITIEKLFAIEPNITNVERTDQGRVG
jgi:hypothetical protein